MDCIDFLSLNSIGSFYLIIGTKGGSFKVIVSGVLDKRIGAIGATVYYIQSSE